MTERGRFRLIRSYRYVGGLSWCTGNKLRVGAKNLSMDEIPSVATAISVSWGYDGPVVDSSASGTTLGIGSKLKADSVTTSWTQPVSRRVPDLCSVLPV